MQTRRQRIAAHGYKRQEILLLYRTLLRNAYRFPLSAHRDVVMEEIKMAFRKGTGGTFAAQIAVGEEQEARKKQEEIKAMMKANDSNNRASTQSSSSEPEVLAVEMEIDGEFTKVEGLNSGSSSASVTSGLGKGEELVVDPSPASVGAYSPGFGAGRQRKSSSDTVYSFGDYLTEEQIDYRLSLGWERNASIAKFVDNMHWFHSRDKVDKKMLQYSEKRDEEIIRKMMHMNSISDAASRSEEVTDFKSTMFNVHPKYYEVIDKTKLHHEQDVWVDRGRWGSQTGASKQRFFVKRIKPVFPQGW